MTLDDYQQLAARTVRPGRPPEQALANWALGLTGEAGEVAEHVKKHLFHGGPLDRTAVVKELGDILWYVAAMAGAVGASLDEIGTTNIEKLRRRYPEGFEEARSVNRAADDDLGVRTAGRERRAGPAVPAPPFPPRRYRNCFANRSVCVPYDDPMSAP